MKKNKKQYTKKNKNKEKKRKNIKTKEEDNSQEKDEKENKIEKGSDEQNKSNKDDIIWIELLEEQMNKYELEISSNDDNSNSDSGGNDKKSIKDNKNETEKETSKIIDSNTVIKEKDSLIETNNNNNLNQLDSSNNANIIKNNEDQIIYNGRVFKNIKKFNNYNSKRKIKKIIYKCKNNRKEEKFRIETKQKPFCEATLEYIEPGQNVKSGYFLKKNHSLECDILEDKFKPIMKSESKKFEDKKDYIYKCETVMNNSSIYDRHLFKETFKEIYNDKKNNYNFPLNDNFLSNIITKWKNNSIKFKKESILYNIKDNENRLLMREYRLIPIEETSKEKNICHEYIIWGNAENIMRIKASKNLFLDSTFHHPPDFYQLLIIMYKDIITGLKIPGLYVLMNSKKEILYQYVFESIIRLLSDDNNINFKFETIVTDQEIGLINGIKKFFPNSQRISCLFHYKQDILRNLKIYGLYKKSYKTESMSLLNDLGKIPFYYKGDMNYFDTECKLLIEKYPNHTNFINNYFISNKRYLFEDQSLNYNKVPDDCRTNSFLENYNGYIKQKLGKKRVINWMNFLTFIKEESTRSINKLYSATSKNLKNKSFSEQINIKNPFHLNNLDKKLKTDVEQFSNIKNKLESEEKHNTTKEDINNIITSKIGLNNLGNTCYMNSSLQILIHIKLFIEELAKNVNPFIKNITYNLFDLAHSLSKINNNENENFISQSYSPINFQKELSNLHSQFSKGQQDAIEFIRTILDDISKETNRNKNKPKYEELILDEYVKEEQSLKYNEFFLKRENSVITDLFYTQMINIFTCKSGCKSYSFQKLLDIPLLIPKNVREVNIYNLLDMFIKEIKVDLKEACKECQEKKINIKKEIRFDILNQILIFSIQRFDPLLSVKNESMILYDEIIDLMPYSDGHLKDNDLKYKLIGTIHHNGTLQYGHYYSIIKINNDWYEFNDSFINKIIDLNYNSSNVCILFYQKI